MVFRQRTAILLSLAALFMAGVGLLVFGGATNIIQENLALNATVGGLQLFVLCLILYALDSR